MNRSSLRFVLVNNNLRLDSPGRTELFLDSRSFSHVAVFFGVLSRQKLLSLLGYENNKIKKNKKKRKGFKQMAENNL